MSTSTTSATSTVIIKATFGSDTRRLRLDATANFKALVAALRPLFFPADSATQFTVTWTDEDGDAVTVAGDPDFIEAKRAQHCDSVLRFAIVASTPPPYPSITARPVAASTPTPAPKSVKFDAMVTDDVTSDAPLGPTKAFLAMLVDRSSSMGSLGGEVLTGIQTYLKEMKASDAEDGSSTSVLMATFDNKYELAHDGLDLPDALKAISQADVEPRGSTALWDGIGFVLRDTEAKIAALPSGDKPDKVIVFILTDGQENTSRTWTQATVKRRMEALKLAPHCYEFFFAAAGQDALATGSHMGLKADECVTWSPDPAAARETFRQSAVNAVRCKKGMSRGYTSQQRSACYTQVQSSGGMGGRSMGDYVPASYGGPRSRMMMTAAVPQMPAAQQMMSLAGDVFCKRQVGPTTTAATATTTATTAAAAAATTDTSAARGRCRVGNATATPPRASAKKVFKKKAKSKARAAGSESSSFGCINPNSRTVAAMDTSA
jgi:hypothetical protein